MTAFGEDLKAQMEEYRNAKAGLAAKAKAEKVIEYECEVSGIDMVVTKKVDGMETHKLAIYLSQMNPEGKGTIFVKTMKGGVIKEATEQNVAAFLKDIPYKLRTGSDIIPELRSGKPFAGELLACAEPRNILWFKHGIATLDMVNHNYSYHPDYLYHDDLTGVPVKFLKYVVEYVMQHEHVGRPEALKLMCASSYDTVTYRDAWQFGTLADVYDEQFAMKCFVEYYDNARLDGLNGYDSFKDFFHDLVTDLVDHGYMSYDESVKAYREGRCPVTLEKNRFWEYVQSSVRVGMGMRLRDFLDMWKDYLNQAYFVDGKRLNKYPENLQVMHDIYSEKYRLIKEFRDKELFEERTAAGAELIDHTYKGYQLMALRTPEDFLTEAQQNCNCVASYVDNVRQGRCWIASFRAKDAEETQLTVEVNTESGSMVQVKGRFNRDPTDEEWSLLKPFQEHICKMMKKAKRSNHTPAAVSAPQ